MLAIKDRTTNETRNLTGEEAGRVADSRCEARHRRLTKQRLAESKEKTC